MEIYHTHHPDHVLEMDTEELRSEFLLQNLFETGKSRSIYSYLDRLIVIGAVPTAPMELTVDGHYTGTDFFLERREAGIINLGESGTVSCDGKEYTLKNTDVLYISRGTKRIELSSADGKAPAQFLCLSGPAHATFPTTLGTSKDANQVKLGSDAGANERTIFQFIHPSGIRSANLVMGFTRLSPGSVWNTMPCHTHTRRMEFYCYFDVEGENRVFHFMGEPTETRHLVVANGEAILCPSWSIHSGVGTAPYCFVWAMLGDNQRFDDMDAVAMTELR